MLLRPLSCLFAGILMSGVALADISPDTAFSGNYLAGRTAGRMRDNTASAEFLTAALKQDDGNPVLVERLFQAHLAMGDVTKAESLALKVIANNSQQRMARIVLGLKDFRKDRKSTV